MTAQSITSIAAIREIAALLGLPKDATPSDVRDAVARLVPRTQAGWRRYTDPARIPDYEERKGDVVTILREHGPCSSRKLWMLVNDMRVKSTPPRRALGEDAWRKVLSSDHDVFGYEFVKNPIGPATRLWKVTWPPAYAPKP